MSYINEKENIIKKGQIIFYPENKKEYFLNNWNFYDIMQPLAGDQSRDWFTEKMYHVLPLIIGNQMGFAIKSNIDLTLFWPGKEKQVMIETNGKQRENADLDIQNYYNTLNSGILSVRNKMIIRTSPGINLMTIQPPNFFIDGVVAMTSIIESDNLRSSFSFNLKVTRPLTKIEIKKGDFLAAFIPVKRYFIDSFKLVDGLNMLDESTLELEWASANKMKSEVADGKEHDRYYNGIFPNDLPFPDHQKLVDPLK
jgi:hypothetical protein